MYISYISYKKTSLYFSNFSPRECFHLGKHDDDKKNELQVGCN